MAPEGMKQSLLKLLCGGSPPTETSQAPTTRFIRDILRTERQRRGSIESVSSSEYSEEEDLTYSFTTHSSRTSSSPSSSSRGAAHLTGYALGAPGGSPRRLTFQGSSSSSTSSSSSSSLKSAMSSPRLLRRIGRGSSIKPLKILVLGQSAVGKTAMTVRFITRRFIGEYDPTLEQKYTFTTELDKEQATFEIFDTAGQSEDSLHIQENIRWADAYILMYSITDRCSFNECTRLRFLINHCRRSRRTGSHTSASSAHPVIIVGNQNDLERDRMVSFEEGQKLAEDLGCARFHEISVRESYQEVKDVFDDVHFLVRAGRKSGGKVLSPPMLCRGASIGGLGTSDDRSESDSDVTCSSTSSTSSRTSDNLVKRKTSMSRRLMRRVFKQDSIFKDSISESLKEDSSPESS